MFEVKHLYVGYNIRKNRKRRKMSQAKLAKIIGVSQRLVSAWETGDRLPASYGLLKIARSLGIGEDELFETPKVQRKDKEY